VYVARSLALFRTGVHTKEDRKTPAGFSYEIVPPTLAPDNHTYKRHDNIDIQKKWKGEIEWIEKISSFTAQGRP